MANPRQRRKLKNPVIKNKKKTNKRKTIPKLGMIQNHWDKTKSLSSNYEQLGLMRTVNKTKGQISERITTDSRQLPNIEGYEHLDADALARAIGPNFGVVERDTEGNIINIKIAGQDEEDLELPKPKELPKSDFLKELEKKAENAISAPKKIGEFERQLCASLIKKYGDDYKAMSRDIQINRDQLSPGQLKKLIKKYREVVDI